MQKCPRCGKNISANVMLKGTVSASWDRYLFKCNNCGADLKIPEVWRIILLMVLCVPTIIYMFFKIHIIRGKVLLFFSTLLFYIILRILISNVKEIRSIQ